MTETELEELLSRPTPGLVETMQRLDGDLMILGVAGKMGLTLARMAVRASELAGKPRRVTGVARFSNPASQAWLHEQGVETIACDLLDRAAVADLPEAPNLIFMAGQKFGTSGSPETAWAMNTVMPTLVAERFPSARTVVFSTGCVYPLVPVMSGGCREDAPLGAIGDYANSCIGRERVYSYFSVRNETPIAIFRLSYAIELRYGVILDVALKVHRREAIDLSMGHARVIWQGDANAQAIQLLEYAASPPFVLNVTGPEVVSIRGLAQQLGELLGEDPIFTGVESETSGLMDAGRSHGLFGYPTVALDMVTHWVADWVQRGGRTLNKPTHFETRDGNY